MFAKRFFQDERGSIESALVLLPLLILVLSVLQISMGVLSRTVISNQTQGAAAMASMSSGAQPSGAQPSLDLPSGKLGSSEQFSLPGGGTLLVRHENNDLPSLTPLLPQGDNFQTLGASVNEGN